MKAIKATQTGTDRYFKNLLSAVCAAGLERKYQAIRRKLIREGGACEFEGVYFKRIEIL